MTDFFDPNLWPTIFGNIGHEFRIYGDDRASVWAVVDEEDYAWCLQWNWSLKFSRGGRKFYLRRAIQSGYGRAGRTRHTRFLHAEIMERTGVEPPSPLHTMIDHRNGDSMDCRRENLRWATPSMNAKNLFGRG